MATLRRHVGARAARRLGRIVVLALKPQRRGLAARLGLCAVVAGAISSAPAAMPLTTAASLGGAPLRPISIAEGATNALALRSDGAVFAWGDNSNCQLGNGMDSEAMKVSSTPVRVIGMSGVASIAAGEDQSLALKSDGTVWAWGNNLYGAVGTGAGVPDPLAGDGPFSADCQPVPAPVPISGVTAISAWEIDSLALKSDGTVWGWGGNSYGQLGAALTQAQTTPVQVPISGVTKIAMGGSFALALKNDGTVWAWGYNVDGELGNGTASSAPVTTPVQVDISGVTAIAAGLSFGVALRNDGTVWDWGDNSNFQLGNTTVAGYTGGHSATPVEVMTSSGAALSGVVTLSAGLAVTGDGTPWQWPDLPTYRTAAAVAGLSHVTDMAGGGFMTLAMTSDGGLWAWGDDYYGELGNGQTNTVSNVPVPVLWAPGPPTGATASPQIGSAAVTWVPPESSGAGSITSYTVTSSGGEQAIVPAPAATAVVSGLSSGSYTFTVTATNSFGTGPRSAASPAVTIIGPPSAPPGASAVAGNSLATVSWLPPSASGSPVVQYVITPYANGAPLQPIPTAGTATSFTVPGLVNGVTYQFTVAGQNQFGLGPASQQSAPVTPNILQGAPGQPSATAGNGQASLQWTPPTPNGGTVQQYVVTAYSSTGNTQAVADTGSSLPTYTFMGLKNGTTYTFTVAARNSIGTGPASPRSNAVTPNTAAGGASGRSGEFQYAELQTDTVGAAGCGSNADGEPQVVVSPSGTVFVGSERSLGSGSDVWRAANGSGGNMASACAPVYYGQPNAVSGTGLAGGDLAAAVASSPNSSGTYTLYVASLNVGSVAVAHSTDDGQTWVNVPLQIGTPGDDREWLAAYGATTSLLSFKDIATGTIDELRSDDGGVTYTEVAQAIPATDYRTAMNQTGSLVIDRRTTAGTTSAPGGLPGFWAYQALVAPSAQGVAFDNQLFVSVSHNGGFTWNLQPIPCSFSATDTNGLNHLFPALSVDPSGNLWAAWSDDSDVYTALSTDHGTTWSCSGPVNPMNSGTTALEPALVATSAGVDLAFYGEPPGLGGSTWYVYFAQNLTGTTSGWGAPQRLAAVHRGPVCELGTGCTSDASGNNDRQLYEDFGIDVDASGWAHIAYSHDAETSSCFNDLGCPGTYTGYLVQDSGVQVGNHN